MAAAGLLYSPYVRTLAGGEHYLYAIAHYLRERGLDVTIATPEVPGGAELARYGFDRTLPLVRLEHDAFPSASARFDFALQVTNTQPLPSRAAVRYTHVQFPYEALREPAQGASPLGRVIVNSEFTRGWVAERWNVRAEKLYPAVALADRARDARRNLILAVGRFVPEGSCKRHDVLIDAFAQLPLTLRRRFRLAIAGRLRDDPRWRSYLEQLRRRAHGLEVEFHVTATRCTIERLYRSASLFWHATGYGRPPSCPERAEHFGIATVEAMARGCVPLVYADGGQTEVVPPGAGCTWLTVEELVERSRRFLEDPGARAPVVEACVRASRSFGFSAFARACDRVFSDLPSARPAPPPALEPSARRGGT